MISYHDRIVELLDCMQDDTISIPEHIKLLREQIYDYTLDIEFKKSKTMGDIMKNALDFVKRNYQGMNMKNFF